MSLLSQLPTKPLRLGEIDRVNWEVVAHTGGELAGELADHPFPLSLRHLDLADPKALRKRYVNLLFAGTPLRFVAWTAHAELTRRAPAELDAADFALVAGF
jgi:hypothetical protein